MSYINSGSCSVSEIEEFLDKQNLVVVQAKDRDNPNANGYNFWSSIKHPETGEILRATKGYCKASDLNCCYYAEYQGEDGARYFYVDSRYYKDFRFRGDKSIFEQQIADSDDSVSKKHSEFFDKKQNDDKTQSGSETHKEFFEPSESASANDKKQGVDDSNGNKNNHSQLQGE